MVVYKSSDGLAWGHTNREAHTHWAAHTLEGTHILEKRTTLWDLYLRAAHTLGRRTFSAGADTLRASFFFLNIYFYFLISFII